MQLRHYPLSSDSTHMKKIIQLWVFSPNLKKAVETL